MRAFTLHLTIALFVIAFAGVSACDARPRCAHHHVGPRHAYPSHAGHVYLVPAPMHSGYASPAAKPAYAYGWFGVKPRRHKGVHHGYYNNYTQWSYR